MPIDLDEMFDALGRQADAVPLGGADRARQRGRRRNRVRAVVSVAAAVVLVAVGAGITLRHPDREALPIDKVIQGTPIPQVGETIDMGGPAAHSIVATDGKRAYVTWLNAEDNGTQVKAADLETGAPAWDAAQPVVDPLRALDRLVVVPSAVLVVTEARDDTKPAVGLHAFDPLTGVPLWSREVEAADTLVFAADMLVQLTARTGRVDGYDWVSGAARWSRTEGAPVTRAVGMAIPDDEAKTNRAGPPLTFSDGRIVLLTGDTAEVRNAATGDLQRTVPMSAPTRGTAVAYDGWLFTHDEADDSPGPQSIRAIDLAGSNSTSIVLEKLPGRFVAMNACGINRVCVITVTEQVRKVTAIDARKRQVLWQRDSSLSGDELSSASGATLVTSETGSVELFNASGELQFKSTMIGGWLDARSLLVVMPDGTGRLARLVTTDARLSPYDRHISDVDGSCTSTAQRLVCAGRTSGLRTWKLG
ncbi:MAG: PQQ-binding-like beta-propeller repeat protein [Jiangellaceae bacterium]